MTLELVLQVPGAQLEAQSAMLAANLTFAVMLIAAWTLKRSLGAATVWFAAFAHAFLTELVWNYQGIATDQILFSFMGMMAVPSLLFWMANRQCIPGLRRGQMTEQQRQAWLYRHGFADRQSGGRSIITR